jgi:plasmid stabilization system protein ParE
VSSNHPTVFLVDVDNTLLDNDAIQQDLKDHLERAFGLAARERYWRILEDLFAELGYCGVMHQANIARLMAGTEARIGAQTEARP